MLVDIMVVALIILQIVIVLNCLKNIFEHKRSELAPGEVTGEPLNTRDLVVQIIGYFIPMVALTMLVFMGNEPIINNLSPNSKMSPLFFLVLLQSFLMAHITISMQVNHITRTAYTPFKCRVMYLHLIVVFFVYVLHLFAMKQFNFKVF